VVETHKKRGGQKNGGHNTQTPISGFKDGQRANDLPALEYPDELT
jgi:hypothetical protein